MCLTRNDLATDPSVPGNLMLLQVSRSVQQVRDFETTLLKAFRAYVKLLQNIVGPADVDISHRRYAEHTASLLHCVVLGCFMSITVLGPGAIKFTCSNPFTLLQPAWLNVTGAWNLQLRARVDAKLECTITLRCCRTQCLARTSTIAVVELVRVECSV
jgi:hypothetical protein